MAIIDLRKFARWHSALGYDVQLVPSTLDGTDFTLVVTRRDGSSPPAPVVEMGFDAESLASVFEVTDDEREWLAIYRSHAQQAERKLDAVVKLLDKATETASPCDLVLIGQLRDAMRLAGEADDREGDD